MKLFIIGAAGSGKTTLARRIGRLLRMEMTNLDDLFWVNNGKNYGVRRPEPERDALFREVLRRESWIVEGAYVEWPKQGIDEADTILCLDIGIPELRRRIVLRFIKRKLGKDSENKIQNLRSLLDLLAWNRKQIPKIESCVRKLKTERENVIVARSKADIESFIEMIGSSARESEVKRQIAAENAYLYLRASPEAREQEVTMGSVSAAKIADIPVGGKIKVNVKGTEIMLANVGGAIYALEDRCPHMGGSLADGVVEGSVIKCPRHGSKFDLATGRNVGQAKILFIKMNVRDAKSYKVEVRGAEVFVESP